MVDSAWTELTRYSLGMVLADSIKLGSLVAVIRSSLALLLILRLCEISIKPRGAFA